MACEFSERATSHTGYVLQPPRARAATAATAYLGGDGDGDRGDRACVPTICDKDARTSSVKCYYRWLELLELAGKKAGADYYRSCIHKQWCDGGDLFATTVVLFCYYRLGNLLHPFSWRSCMVLRPADNLLCWNRLLAGQQPCDADAGTIAYESWNRC